MKSATARRAVGPAAVFCVLFVVFGNAVPQEAPRRGTVGLSTAIQESQFDILLPMWLSNRVVLAPAFSAVWVEDGGQDISLGFNLRKYDDPRRKVTPYYGGRFGALMNMPKGGDTVTDYLFGVMLGGEFFLVRQFSFGIEAQINATFSNRNSTRFGNPGGVNINTGSVFVANIYF
jgi:hypothetical protein